MEQIRYFLFCRNSFGEDCGSSIKEYARGPKLDPFFENQ